MGELDENKDTHGVLRKHKEEVPYQRGKTQDYGYRIHSLESLKTAWEEADHPPLGEYLVVRLNDGRVLTVEKGKMGPIEPTVVYSYDDEKGKPHVEEMSAWDFFRLEPVVYDPFGKREATVTS